MHLNGERELTSRIRKYLQLILMAGMLASLSTSFAGAKLYGFNIVLQDNVMLHFDLDSSAAAAELFSLSNPHRLVVDMPRTTLDTKLPPERFSQGLVKGIRYGQHGEAYLRVVIDLREAVSPTYQVVPRQGGQRLVVDLGVSSEKQYADVNLSSARLATPSVEVPANNTSSDVAPAVPLRDAVIAIDAGHGGKDSGAVGPNKTLEKDITLAIAEKLYQKLLKQPGIKPVMVRTGDTYVGLRMRMEIARKRGADLFVSIHADAVDRRGPKGSSVYTLSMDGASSEAAAWLAKSENESAALFGDVELDGMDDFLSQTLLNLAQSATMEMSMEAGADILQELKTIGNVHKRTVEQAAFAVLKSPDIPSVLVETAFLSNPEEERKLNTPSYQNKLADSIERGLVRFLWRRAPEGTFLAAERKKQG